MTTGKSLSIFNVSRRGFLESGGPLAAMSAMTQTVVAAVPSAGADISGLPHIKQELVDPPFVPEHK